MEWTHADLVRRAERWLYDTCRCSVVFTELTVATPSGEIPDAIGWCRTESVLVECKANRADFLSDKRKVFRWHPPLGMGRYRFYLCPPGVIRPEDLPERWGLIYTGDTPDARLRRVRGPRGHLREWSDDWAHAEYSRDGEHLMMLSALSRLRLRGHLPTIYERL